MRLLGALVLVTCVACGSPVVSSTAAIVNGTPTTGDLAVVGLTMRRASCDQSPGLICTGTLIASRVVLTAAHCLTGPAGQTGIELYFGADTLGDPSGQLMLASSFAIEPGYDEATGANDIGLLQLPRDAPVAAQALGAAPPPAGSAVRIVGFGATATDDVPDGVKRSGTMTVSSIDATTIELTPAPSNSCVGDSGGPVLAGAAGAEQIVGVTARGDSGCVTSAVAERIDGDTASFISSFVATAEAAPAQAGFGGQDFSHLCTGSCGSDADCPAGFTCRVGDSPARCVVASNLPGSLGESCAHDADCGPQTTCARIDPDSCRCLRPCSAASGCDMSRQHPTTYHFVFMCFFVVVGLLRRASSRI